MPARRGAWHLFARSVDLPRGAHPTPTHRHTHNVGVSWGVKDRMETWPTRATLLHPSQARPSAGEGEHHRRIGVSCEQWSGGEVFSDTGELSSGAGPGRLWLHLSLHRGRKKGFPEAERLPLHCRSSNCWAFVLNRKQEFANWTDH